MRQARRGDSEEGAGWERVNSVVMSARCPPHRQPRPPGIRASVQEKRNGLQVSVLRSIDQRPVLISSSSIGPVQQQLAASRWPRQAAHSGSVEAILRESNREVASTLILSGATGAPTRSLRARRADWPLCPGPSAGRRTQAPARALPVAASPSQHHGSPSTPGSIKELRAIQWGDGTIP